MPVALVLPLYRERSERLREKFKPEERSSEGFELRATLPPPIPNSEAIPNSASEAQRNSGEVHSSSEDSNNSSMRLFACLSISES